MQAIDWNSTHSLWLYGPMLLILTVPASLLIAACVNKSKQGACVSCALLALALGTVAVYGTYRKTPIAWNFAITSGQLQSVLQGHRSFTAEAFESLVLATLLFALGCLICKYTGFRPSQLTITVPLGFLVFYLLGIAALLDAAVEGERLAHAFGSIGAP